MLARTWRPADCAVRGSYWYVLVCIGMYWYVLAMYLVGIVVCIEVRTEYVLLYVLCLYQDMYLYVLLVLVCTCAYHGST